MLLGFGPLVDHWGVGSGPWWTEKIGLYTPIPSFLPFVALEIYFSLAGEESELVLPKNLDYKKKLQRGPRKDIDFFSE